MSLQGVRCAANENLINYLIPWYIIMCNSNADTKLLTCSCSVRHCALANCFMVTYEVDLPLSMLTISVTAFSTLAQGADGWNTYEISRPLVSLENTDAYFTTSQTLEYAFAFWIPKSINED